MFLKNTFTTTIENLAKLLVPFVTTSIVTYFRDKLESTPSQKPLPQYFFPYNCESLCGGILLMPDCIMYLIFN